MIVLAQSKNNKWTISEYKEDYSFIRTDEYSSGAVGGILLDYIENSTEPTDVYIWDFSTYVFDLLLALRTSGFKMLSANPKLKQMKEREVKALIKDDFTPYTIVVKRKRHGIRFVNASMICKEPNEDLMLALLQLSGQKRKPFTMTAIAKKVWQDFGDNTAFYLSRVLPNAITTKVGETTLEKYVRPSYHGGFLADNADGNHSYKDVSVWDINSLYSWVMKNKPLPRGVAHYRKGKPTSGDVKLCERGNIYIYAKIRATFELKPDGIPCLRLPYEDVQRLTHERGWLTTSRHYFSVDNYYGKDEPVELTLSWTDLRLMNDNYNVKSIEYIDYVWQPTSVSLFDEYIGSFYSKKSTATGTSRGVYKSLLNNLSGNMAKYPKYSNVSIKFTQDDEDPFDYDFTTSAGKRSYIYVGSAITSYARERIINLIKLNRDRWLYTDTDSLHLKGSEPPKGVEVSGALGDVKLEHEYREVVYYKKKMYVGMQTDGTAHIVLAGIPNKTREYLKARIEARETGNKSKIIGFVEQTERQEKAIDDLFNLQNMSFDDYKERLAFRGDIEEDLDETRTQMKFRWLDENIFNAKTLEKALLSLYRTPLPIWQYDSDLEFGRVEQLQFRTIEKEYNFL